MRRRTEFATRSAHQLTAGGASASMSVTTSMIAGRPAVSARPRAGPISAGFSTRIPTAPISSAMRAKLTLRKVHISRPCSGWRPAIDAVDPALRLVAARIVVDHRHGVDAPAGGGLDLGDVVPETRVAREGDHRPIGTCAFCAEACRERPAE